MAALVVSVEEIMNPIIYAGIHRTDEPVITHRGVDSSKWLGHRAFNPAIVGSSPLSTTGGK